MIEHVTSAQVRAARGLLNWSVRDLAQHSGVHRNTITNIETGRSGGDQNTIGAIVAAFKRFGVSFTFDNGVGTGVKFTERQMETP